MVEKTMPDFYENEFARSAVLRIFCKIENKKRIEKEMDKVRGNHQNNGKVFENKVKSQEEAILANIKSNRSRPTFLNFINCASLRASFLDSVGEIKEKIPSGYKRYAEGDGDKNRLKRNIT